MKRRGVRHLIAVAVLGAGLSTVGAATPAMAGPASTRPSCSANIQIAISPGLTMHLANRTETTTLSLTRCANGPVTSGSAMGTLSGSQSCRSGTTTGDLTITWNNGRKSELAAALSTKWYPRHSTLYAAFSATVVKGVFQGGAVSPVGRFVTESMVGNCRTRGVPDIGIGARLGF